MSLPITTEYTNLTHKFSNSSNNNKFSLNSNSIQITADNTNYGNTLLSPAGITNSITGQTAPFANLSQLPLLQTALYAVNQPPDQQTLAVNSKLYLENANPPDVSTKSITIDAGNLLIDYESVDSDDLILQSSSSGSLKFIQTGVDATTKQLIMNPTQVSLQDTDKVYDITDITNDKITISSDNYSLGLNSNVLTITGTGTTKNIALGLDQLYMYNGSVAGTLSATNYSGIASSANLATNALNVNITTDNTSGTYYLPFAKTSGTGNKSLFIDDTTTPLTYNPATSTLTATKFIGDCSGNAVSATNINLTSDNSSGSYYIPFSKSTAGVNPLYIDDSTTPLTYNPNTGTLFATSFNGIVPVSNTTNNVNISSYTGVGTTFYPVFTGGQGTNTMYIDNATAPFLSYNPVDGILSATTFAGALSGTATNSLNVSITSDNTAGTYFIPFSKTSGTGNKPLYMDDTTGPLSYNPSTSTLTASTFSGALSGTATSATTATNITTTTDNTSGTYYIPFSKTTAGTSTALYLDDTTTPLTYNPSTSTLSSTIFSTATAPVSGSQLGNKTYIDNFGGGAGWYYTASVNNGGTSSTTYAFPNCFSNNLNNAYDVYFVFNFSAPTTGYFSCNMSFTGLGTTTYYNWTTTTSNATTPTITTAYTSANAYIQLLSSMDATSFYYLRSATPKISIWGAISGSGGAGTAQTQFSAENFGSANPGLTGTLKSWGFTQQTTGYITGTTLTFSSAMTGTATIVVKGRA